MPALSLRVLCIGAALLVGTPTAPFSQTSTARGGAAAAVGVGGLPLPAERNIWYRYKDSNTVVVFVHGIFSNIRDCWHYQDAGNPARSCWPEMISRDPTFGDAAIFLAGYYTAPGSRAYDIPQSAADIRDALVRRTRGQQRVIDRPNIVFVAHSTGGIVVRHLLYHNQELFRGKNVGLVLMASPSRGSYYANYLRLLSSLFGNRMAQQLQVNDPYLDQLHDNFRDLLAYQRTRGINIKGIERCENHMIIVRKLWFDGRLVVDPESCAVYFGSPRILAGTDHFGTVKPDSPSHPGYVALDDFYGEFVREAVTNEPRLNLEVVISPRANLVHDTVQDVRRLLVGPADCAADTTLTDRHTVAPRWKIRMVGNPMVPTSQAGRLLVEGVQQEGDSAVRVRVRIPGSSGAACPLVPATYEYALQIFAERLEPKVLDELAIPSVQLTPAQPTSQLTYTRVPDDPRIRDLRWLYRVYVSGRTRTTQVPLELSNAKAVEAGIRTHISAKGELSIDARSALLP